MHIPTPEEIKQADLEKAQEIALLYTRLFSIQHGINEDLSKDIAKLAGEIEDKKQLEIFQKDILSKYQKMMFGKSSEKRASEDSVTDETEDVVLVRKKKKREKFGYKQQPELPIEEVVHELPKEEQICPECTVKADPWEGQFEICDVIHVKPVEFFIQRHKRQKYITPCEHERILTAPGPVKLKEGSRYSIEFGVEAGINKYEMHLPMDRQARMMKRCGLDIGTNTIFSQLDTIAWYLKPTVYEGLRKTIQKSRINHADESPWKNLSKDAKKKFWLWGVRNKKAVVFQIADSRSRKVADSLLGELKGVLLTDGLTVYNKVGSKDLIHACCWSHARRKFIQAEKSFPKEAEEFIKLIRELYEIETDLRGKSPDEILRQRQDLSKKVIDSIWEKLLERKNFLPKSSLGQAVQYTINLWDKLKVFLSQPDVPLDNNSMERAIRGPVVGRKNHYGSKSIKSAEVAAIWYSVIETCKAHDVDSKRYITATLNNILRKKPVAMPWEFKKS